MVPTPYALCPTPGLLRPRRIPDDVVHRPPHELEPLLDPALRLRPDVGEAPLDVGDLEAPQLVLDVEMMADQRLELAADDRALRLGRAPMTA